MELREQRDRFTSLVAKRYLRNLPVKTATMPIFRAIGFGIFIVMLKLLLPSVLGEGEQTMIAFLHGARISADVASGLATSAASLNTSSSTLPRLAYPQTSSIPNY